MLNRLNRDTDVALVGRGDVDTFSNVIATDYVTVNLTTHTSLTPDATLSEEQLFQNFEKPSLRQSLHPFCISFFIGKELFAR